MSNAGGYAGEEALGAAHQVGELLQHRFVDRALPGHDQAGSSLAGTQRQASNS